jgi:4-hydroxybenzoate polyprenyltransferase
MRAEPRWDRLALLAGLLVGNQYAAGALNDAVDADADAAADRGKPIQRGVISRRAVATAAVVAGVASLGFGLALGPATFALAVVGLACAWSYDLWLKGTMFSALPFAVAVPLVPLFGYGAAGRFPAVLWWAWPIGALLAVATHLADALPDVERDRATGVRGLATRLGVGRAAAVAAACYAAAVVMALVSGLAAGDRPVVAAGAALAVALGLQRGSAAALVGLGLFQFFGQLFLPAFEFQDLHFQIANAFLVVALELGFGFALLGVRAALFAVVVWGAFVAPPHARAWRNW